MSEDDRYRTSTQFRLWSYTSQSLLALRSTTNKTAADRVREAVRRLREARNVSATNAGEAENVRAGSAIPPEGEVDCLTVEEELKLVAFYCRETMKLGDHLKEEKIATNAAKATAIQYIKRFYITNSLMTYHPTDILKTALFFATKTENHYFRLTKFADAIGKTKPEDVLASEFLLTQGLRFTFDVRHPFRALEGAVMELQALSTRDIPAVPGSGAINGDRPRNMGKRVIDAHGKAREYLKTSALLTDVYFHFTPSQIMLAALMLADLELMAWYIGIKVPASMGDQQKRVLSTLEKCAAMLRTVDPNSEPSAVERKELQALAKKLKKCRNPEKMDLVGLQRAKREGEEGIDEKVVKKRKLEKEKSSADDLFGPEIKRV
ncbi:hypothetical protein QTJ16_001095 [Diplocarpon rosae]|uniref:Cyclin C-terminal domain-containing protein n=1 Tax=Diplocarpon rosae TaxID=946125 RepID=A0AAD9T848_9HELO|nr:hypothetical protein QTJ16_001095 [Diplocarpon rosae]